VNSGMVRVECTVDTTCLRPRGGLDCAWYTWGGWCAPALCMAGPNEAECRIELAGDATAADPPLFEPPLSNNPPLSNPAVADGPDIWREMALSCRRTSTAAVPIPGYVSPGSE
jgi:hypothetical protein